MSLLDLIQDKAWALTPAKLDEINTFLEARLADPAYSIELARGKSGNRAEDRYEVRDGVAIIPVYGVLDKRANLFMEISGGTSTQLLQRDIKQALYDPMVDSILLDIDSPGGAVDGTKELADFLVESRGKKPIIAFANGLMASAAYWIGSAADRIIANDTAMVGSIGVALTHYDRSEQDAKLGVKRTMVYAGKYKRIASDEKPLSEEGQEYLQGIVDTYYTIFIESIAGNRGMDPEQVIAKMADGREFIGKQAKKAGLVDHIAHFETALTITREKGRQMDLATLKEKHPEVFQEVYDLGAASVEVEKIKAEANDEGVLGERLRTLAIVSLGGDPDLTLKAIEDGIDADAAGKMFFLAEKEDRAKQLDRIEQDQSESAGHGARESGKPAGDFMSAVEAYRKAHNCSATAALSAVASKHPELHQAYVSGLEN